jgi:hypothetical protein
LSRDQVVERDEGNEEREDQQDGHGVHLLPHPSARPDPLHDEGVEDLATTSKQARNGCVAVLNGRISVAEILNT